ncbi:hypothetical protein HDU91_003417, partial [Kappamyces sp. JEL0680]
MLGTGSQMSITGSEFDLSDAPSSPLPNSYSEQALDSVFDPVRSSTASKYSARPSNNNTKGMQQIGSEGDDLPRQSVAASVYTPTDNGTDYSHVLQPDVVMSDSQFTENFNASTGFTWKVPVLPNISAATPVPMSPITPLSPAGSKSSITEAISALTTSPVSPGGSKGINIPFRLFYGDEPPVYMKISSLAKMEHFCQKLCARKGLDYEVHSFEYGEVSKTRPIEMDMTFSHYSRNGNQFDLHLVKKGKTYSSIATKEGEEETMIVNLVDARPVIMGCKKEKIFDLLCDPNFQDEKFSNVIFLTYRSFSSTEEFLTHLIRTFYVRLSDTPTELERDTFEKNKVPTQLKVLK